MKIRSRYSLFLILIFFVSCNENTDEFESFTYDRTKDLFQSLAKNLNPNDSYTYWAFLCSTRGFGDAKILHEGGDINQKDLLNLRSNLNGFFSWGHHADRYYYVHAVKDGQVIKIEDVASLLEFLDEIDTKEEAFLIAKINEFVIDPCMSEGNSYRKIKNGYQLLLIGPDSYSEGYTNIDLKRTQHLVTINTNGELSTRLIGVYCESDEACMCD